MRSNDLKSKATPNARKPRAGSSGQKSKDPNDPLNMWPFPKTFDPSVPHHSPPTYERVTPTFADMTTEVGEAKW